MQMCIDSSPSPDLGSCAALLAKDAAVHVERPDERPRAVTKRFLTLAGVARKYVTELLKASTK